MNEVVSTSWWHVTIIITLGFAPGFFWLWYIYRRDLEPEPLHLIRNCFIAGMGAVIAVGLLGAPAKALPSWVVAVIVAPVIEECIKFGACYAVAYRDKDFNEPMDGVVCAVAVALGFASLENVFYLFDAMKQGISSLTFTTLVRAFFTVPGHALFGIMWGYALGRAKFEDQQRGRRIIAVGLLTGIAAHSFFNLMCVLEPLWAFGMMFFIPVAWGLANRKILRATELSPHSHITRLKAKVIALKESLALGPNSSRWFDNQFVVVLLLFFLFFPAGFYALYKNTTFSKPEKVAYVALWFVCAISFQAWTK